MSTEGGGPKSMLKSRAENFARHLQTRLRSLSESEDGTWTSAAEVPSLSSSSENETFFEVDSNITSPEEEIAEPEYIAHTNHVDDLSSADISFCNETRLSSVDEQFYDSVDPGDTERTEESTQLESPTACHCKPVSLPFPIPYRSHQRRTAHEKTYSDAQMSSPTGDSFSKLEETHANLVVVKCNGCPSTSVDALVCSEHLMLTREEESEPLRCVTEDAPTADYSQEGGSDSGPSIDDHLPKPETTVTMDEDEDKLSLSDLLQVIHNELKLEGKHANGSATREEGKSPQINILEVPVESTSKSTSKRLEEEEEDIETRRLRFRRCSSLKSGKTPPGTPGRKKIVRFADVLGLDLADVKTFLDEVPTIPKSAYEDLYGVESSTPPSAYPFSRTSQPPERVVVPLFQQPGGHPNFIEKLRRLNVCLENAIVSDPSLLAISGTVRVRNIDYHKSVHIRYTLNSWKSFADLQARYVPNSCDGFSDKFTFLMYAHTLVVGQRLAFAVRFQARGTQFWDNNGGVNYVFECVNQNNSCFVAAPDLPPSQMDLWPNFY